MRKTVILIFLFFISNYSFSQSGWYQIYSTSNSYLYDIIFTDGNNGYCVGSNDRIFKTINSGISWSEYAVSSNSYNSLLSVKFINNNTGYACGGLMDTYAMLKYRFIYKTTNQGANWFTCWNSPDFAMNYYISLSVFSGDTLYACARGQYDLGGSFGFFEKTTNGGTNFLINTLGPGYNSMQFINYYTGWTSAFYIDDIGNRKDYIYKTTDAGANWIIQYLDSVTAASINKIQFINQNTGFGITGTYYGTSLPKLLKTTNGGINWSVTNIAYSNSLKSLFFINENTGWICGYRSSADSSVILKTTDGGLTFNIQKKVPYFEVVNSLYFQSPLVGYAVSGNGIIYKTTTGGVTYANNIINEIPASFSLSQNYPNPFNPTTIIRFQIKDSKTTTLKVFDLLGREVQTLVNEKLKPGEYEVTFDGSNLPSGVYFYKLQAGDFTETKKMILIK